MKRGLGVFLSVLTVILIISGCSVKIEKIVAEEIPAINVGDTYQIKYNVEPDNTTDQTVEFAVSDEKIATVDTKGLITALAPGRVEISILPNDEERNTSGDTKTGTKISVTIIQPVKKVECKPKLTIAVGKFANINAVAFPENASNKTFKYKSSDESVATVDAAGQIAGLKKGKATVTVTSANGLHAECEVIVKQPITGIKLNRKSLELGIAESAFLEATLSPKGANMNTEVTFSSSNKSVATVDAKGNITGISEGEATISAVVLDVDNKKITAKCVVTVYKPYVPEPKADYNEPDDYQSDDYQSNDVPNNNILEIQPFVPSWCPACGGSGISISGDLCYICDGTGKNPELNN